MGCTVSHALAVEEQSASLHGSYNDAAVVSGHATIIAGTRRSGVCWCGNFCREMLDPKGNSNPSRPRCCLHSAGRPWTRQCDACRQRNKEARAQRLQYQKDIILRQIHVSNGIYHHKKACCGMPCHILSCRFCCEHMHKPPANPQSYCGMCRDRVSSSPQMIGDQGASNTFCSPCQPPNKKDTSTDALNKNHSGSESVGEDLFPTVVEEECPICLEELPIDELCRLPCGHLVCHGHIDKLERCPLCRHTVPGTAVVLMAISAWRKRHGEGGNTREIANEPIE